MSSLAISDVGFVRGSPADQRAGLVGFVSFVLDDALRLDGVTVRRTAAGRMSLSFPTRRDSAGRVHPFVRPLDREARAAIEGQVLAALEAEGALP